MTVRPRQRTAVEAEDELCRPRRVAQPRRGHLGQHRGPLVADPAARTRVDEAADERGVPASVVGLEVGDHRAVEHHGDAVRRRLLDQARQRVEKVAGAQVGRVGRGHGDGRSEPGTPFVLLRPDQVGQPGGRVGIGHVERVQVDPGPPPDDGTGVGQRGPPVNAAGQLGRPGQRQRRRRRRRCSSGRRSGRGRGTAPRSRRPRPARAGGVRPRRSARRAARGSRGGPPRWSGYAARGSCRGSCRRRRAAPRAGRRTGPAPRPRATGRRRRRGWAVA